MKAYLTPKEYASLYGRHINTVMKWIHRGWLPWAYYRPSRGRIRYLIPSQAPPPKKRPGPPRGEKRRERNESLYLLQSALKLKAQIAALDDHRLDRKEY